MNDATDIVDIIHAYYDDSFYDIANITSNKCLEFLIIIFKI